MANDPVDRFEQARSLGIPALLRLRAETLLDYADKGEITVTPEERDELERIAAAPKPHDAEFLAEFDDRLGAEE
jgi:hypothetical protein